MEVITPLSNTMVVLESTDPVAVCNVAPVMAMGSDCIGAGLGRCAKVIEPKAMKQRRLKMICFFMIFKIKQINDCGYDFLLPQAYHNGKEILLACSQGESLLVFYCL